MSSPTPKQVSPSVVVALVAALVVFMLYMPGVFGPFLHDDFGQITLNPDLKINELTLENLSHADNKYPSRPLPMMSFALNYLQCGESPSCFKTTNILLHLFSGAAIAFLLWTLGRAAARRQAFALPESVLVGATLLWLVHPLHASTTLYVVQRMAIMATLFSVLALGCYLQARFLADNLRQRIGWAIAALACAVLAGLSKENALLILPLAALLELLLLDDHTRARITRPRLLGLAVTVGFFAALALIAIFPPDRIAGAYLQREFTPPQRLLTEARILWYYVSEIGWPDASRMNLFLDSFTISRSLLDPVITLAAAGGWFVVIALSAGELLRRPSLPAFGVLFFVAGHLIESSVIGLVLAYEHRNYLPSLGLLLAIAWLVHRLVADVRIRVGLIAILFVICGWQLKARVSTWSSETGFVTHLMQPRWANSYDGMTTIARYYAQEASVAESEALARLYAQKSAAAYSSAAEMGQDPTLALVALLMRSPTQDESLGYWKKLQELAVTRPVTPNTLNAANTLAVCLLSPYCPLARQEFAVYIDALLANPRKNRVSTTLLKRTAGTFYIKVYNQPEKGLALSRQAADLGMAEARESYIKNLAFLGRTEEARAAYERFAQDVPLNEERRQRIEAAIDSPGVVLP